MAPPGDRDDLAPVRAEAAPELAAEVVASWPLHYAGGASAAEDRPGFVRAASGLARLGADLVIAQDDASFLALARPGESARARALPRGPGGRRRFEDALGNKDDKLDLESCVAVPGPAGPRVIAFGSGSLLARQRLAIFDPQESPALRLFDAGDLYARLRAERRFSGGELNLEGAAVVGPALRLFQRGNGERPGTDPVPATLDLALTAFLAWIDGARDAPPELGAVTRYDLGTEQGARFGFTDADALGPHRVVFLASAERSPDAVLDGEVLGSRIGWIEGDRARWTALRAPGLLATTPLKAEGIALDPERPDRAWIVLDPDDPARPTELCEVRLAGPWREL